MPDLIAALFNLLGLGGELSFRFNAETGHYEVRCPACKQWCEARVHDPGTVTSEVSCDNVSLVDLRINPTLCVHDHECPTTGEIAQTVLKETGHAHE